MEGVQVAIEMMALAARTAPKAHGDDFIVLMKVHGEKLRQLGEAMIEYERGSGPGKFVRDGHNVLASQAVLLIGLKNATALDANCGACGEDACLLPNTHEGLEFRGPQCALRVLDMGIALGSAAKMAGMLNVDNRLLYTTGAVACKTGLIDADFAIGIALSASGKNIYFDRA
jgi:uncharacterized ferredoxin-like protein